MAKGEVSSEMEKAVFWVQFSGMLFKSHTSDLSDSNFWERYRNSRLFCPLGKASAADFCDEINVRENGWEEVTRFKSPFLI